TSEASNLVLGDTNGTRDVFLFDGAMGRTERVSVSATGEEANRGGQNGVISDDGRYVAFSSGSTNLIPGDSHGGDILLRDRLLGPTEGVGVRTGGSTTTTGYSDMPPISADGRYVVFRSLASDLVPGDTNGYTDVFLHDRLASGFTVLCEPGTSGVVPCPCSNPPSGPGRGCEHSSAAGGASLSASGIAYLSIDDLFFTTTGEGSTATSILFQGDAALSSGAVYGQGVRCAGGRLERLFVEQAVAGGIQVPDFVAGDPSISARSAS